MNEDNKNKNATIKDSKFGPVSYAVLVIGLVLMSIIVLLVPSLVAGTDVWFGIDWIDGRKLYSIDDAYRYFTATIALQNPTLFLWNYVMPVALFFDAVLASLFGDSLLGMRFAHAAMGVATLAVVARCSLRAGCGPWLALASVSILALMPLFVVLSSSFYGEGLFAFLVAVAFLMMIESRTRGLAVVVSLLPLVRPEGTIFAAMILVHFGMRKDYKHCALVILPGVLYLVMAGLVSEEWLSSLSWRLELRKIIAPLSPESIRSVSIDRLPNLVWAALALVPLFMKEYRRWWPMLVAPWCLVFIQLWTVSREVQDFELRYLYSTLPVFAVAWALPIRRALDANNQRSVARAVIAFLCVAGSIAVIAQHMRQSDWVRFYFSDSALLAELLSSQRGKAPDFDDRNPLFDTKPLRGFAARVDRLIEDRTGVETVFVTSSPSLYFLDFADRNPDFEVVLIPHSPGVASYSGGYFFGFSLRSLQYRYYRFTPTENSTDASAVLVVKETGQNPFDFAAGSSQSRPPGTVANVQSGLLKAYAVDFKTERTVDWSIPSDDGP